MASGPLRFDFSGFALHEGGLPTVARLRRRSRGEESGRAIAFLGVSVTGQGCPWRKRERLVAPIFVGRDIRTVTSP